MSKLLTVFGATGNQGGSVIRAVLADPILSKQFTLRGITRDAFKPAAKELVAKGVEIKTVRMCGWIAHHPIPIPSRSRAVVACLVDE